MSVAYSIEGVEGLPEITQGDDLARLIADAVDVEDGDILVVTSKVVSKSEGRIVLADDREAAITAETVRVVATRVEGNRDGRVRSPAALDEHIGNP